MKDFNHSRSINYYAHPNIAQDSTKLKSISIYDESVVNPEEIHHNFIIPFGSFPKIEHLVNRCTLFKKKETGLLKALYIISEVTKHCIYFDYNGCSIHASSTSKLLGVKHQEFAELMNLLSNKEDGLINKIRGYKNGVTSYKYILSERTEMLEEVKLLKQSKLELKIKHKQAKHINKSHKLSLYYQFLKKITINIPTQYLMMGDFTDYKVTEGGSVGLRKTNYRFHAINELVNNRIRISRPVPNSRVHTNLTNLPKEYKQFLEYEGQKLEELDIRNSQPLIATLILKEYWKELGYNEMPEDLHRYQQDCENGVFYDYFMEINGIPEEERGQFKKRFFANLFFSAVYPTLSSLAKQFQEKYPTCYDAICAIKGGVGSQTYNQFAIRLQEVEAQIIFDEVNVGLLKDGIPAFNIFDSILYLPQHREEVFERIIKAFSKRGLRPKLNSKSYGNLAA